MQVRAYDDAVVEGFHHSDMTLTAAGGQFAGKKVLSVVDIADNDYAGVRVMESNSSSDVVEFDPTNHCTGACSAAAAAKQFEDTYRIVLTKQPGAGESVKVIVRSEPTRTDKTGGIRSFIEQVANRGLAERMMAALLDDLLGRRLRVGCRIGIGPSDHDIAIARLDLCP